VVLNIEGLNLETYKLNLSQVKLGLYFTTIELNNKNSITKKVIIE